MARHYAIFVGNAIEKILKSEKTLEGRFTQDKIPPYGCLAKGDVIFLKQAGGLVVGKVEVDNVLFFNDLDGEKIGRLRKEYSDDLGVSEDFWIVKQNARFASIIFLKNPQRFLTPLRLKKKDRRPWVVER
ncbi:hypothetical protein HY373_02085 [Candidatus Berkelbacteria bacterium]|nr:hypothetical protein [Candidatus Berkelbacteria bacterium]MBI2588318.1 hypothetical protein [Candidatus Berkelbacteria bacterium]MBI4029947.1 hypothetical protein [Candidatus Berkelbacteria bacterium]